MVDATNGVQGYGVAVSTLEQELDAKYVESLCQLLKPQH